MIDKILQIGMRMLFWIGVYLEVQEEIQKVAKLNSSLRNGGNNMFDKKMMKVVKFDKIGKYFAEGEPVYMVAQNGTLVEITVETDMETLFFHNMCGGVYAVNRKKFGDIGAFAKTIKLAGWTLSIIHEEKEADAE